MFRQLVGAVTVITCCLTVSLSEAVPRKGGGGGGGGRSGGREAGGGGGAQGARSAGGRGQASGLGGAWSGFNGGTGHGANQPGGMHYNTAGAHSATGGAALGNRSASQASGAQGAAAGAAFNKRNAPNASGAEGAAAGAGIANRNSPEYSGAQGAAAGASHANRNDPQYSGAQGAAAGAAVNNRNSPQYSGAQGAAAGAAVANRNEPEYSGAQGAAAATMVGARTAAPSYAAVRGNFNHPDVYGQSWYGNHPNAWSAKGWAANAAWTPATWAVIAGANRYNSASMVSYNYGNNVTCIDNNVVVDGQPVGTAEEFAQEAADLAELGAVANLSDTDKWMPLGVFAMVRNEQQHPSLIMQLAVNQNGVLRGNYTDEVTDSTQPIQGAVDSKTQRAAWTVGDNNFCVMEAGLSNLTQNELPALIHKNGTTQRWLLVRLEQPDSAAK